MSRLATLALLCTLGLGISLRVALGGGSLPWDADFAHVRHAHSHLGIYGLLFPAFLVAARAAGRGELPRSLHRAYPLAVVIAAVGFVYSGYGAISIAASTVVLAVWIFVTVTFRRTTTRAWIDVAPIALALSSMLVFVVALAPRFYPAFAQPLARALTALLLLGVFTPAALHSMGAHLVPAWRGLGAPCPIAAYLVTATAAAFSLGVDPSVWFRPFVAVIGVWIAALAWRSAARTETRLAFVIVGLGLVAYAARILPASHGTAIAGTHAFILGPLFSAFAPRHLPRTLHVAWLGIVGIMTASLIAPDIVPALAVSPTASSQIAAVLGLALFSIAAAIAFSMLPSAFRFTRKAP